MKNILLIALAIIVVVLLRKKKTVTQTGKENPGTDVDDDGTVTVTFENADGTTTTKVVPDGMYIATKPPVYGGYGEDATTSFNTASSAGASVKPTASGTVITSKGAQGGVSSKFTPRFSAGNASSFLKN